jgi:hypothetical protein
MGKPQNRYGWPNLCPRAPEGGVFVQRPVGSLDTIKTRSEPVEGRTSHQRWFDQLVRSNAEGLTAIQGGLRHSLVGTGWNETGKVGLLPETECHAMTWAAPWRLLHLSQPGVQLVSKPVAEEVQGHHGQEDAHAGDGGDPPRR